MQAIVAQALRACSRTLPAVPRRAGFLIAPSYKSRVAVAFRGYAATATATKKPAAATKKPAAAAKKKTATAAKKKTATATKKAAAGKKATAAKTKPKKAVKKPAAAKPKKKKKELTPEQKASVEKRQLKKDTLAASQPKKLPYTNWMLFCKQEAPKRFVGSSDLGATVKSVSADYKKLPASELQRMTEECKQNAAQNDINYKKWVENHSVDEIARANRARSKLYRRYKIKCSPLKITDERLPKRPTSAFALFIKANRDDFAGAGTTPEILTALSAKWRALGESEKKAFTDLSNAERLKYAQEHPQPDA